MCNNRKCTLNANFLFPFHLAQATNQAAHTQVNTHFESVVPGRGHGMALLISHFPTFPVQVLAITVITAV